MQTKMTQFSVQGLPLQEPNNLQESVRNQFEANGIEPEEILRWEDDGGQIIRSMNSPSQLYS